jgi:hypothetical protein
MVWKKADDITRGGGISTEFVMSDYFRQWCMENVGYLPEVWMDNLRLRNSMDEHFWVKFIFDDPEHAMLFRFKFQ